MMARTTTDLPAYVNSEIYQGFPWAGVSVRYVDLNGDPEEVTIAADVATDTTPRGGVWLATCDISEPDADDYVFVTLDADTTAALPARTVLIDVKALRDGQIEPSLVMRVTAAVRGGLPPEPEPEPEP